MKKLLIVLGGVFAVIIILIIIAAAIFIPRAIKLDHQATAYLKDAVPKIVDHWNSQEPVSRATPQLMSVAKSQDEIDRLFVMFGQLGSLKHLEDPKGAVYTGTYMGQGTATIGNFTVQGDFEKGPATLKIQLFRVGDGWKINGFHIDSTVFLPPKTLRCFGSPCLRRRFRCL